jgi:hypothetical protein
LYSIRGYPFKLTSFKGTIFPYFSTQKAIPEEKVKVFSRIFIHLAIELTYVRKVGLYACTESKEELAPIYDYVNV